MTSVLDQLASASGEAKQDLNIALAQKIVKEKSTDSIKELISGLGHKPKAYGTIVSRLCMKLQICNQSL